MIEIPKEIRNYFKNLHTKYFDNLSFIEETPVLVLNPKIVENKLKLLLEFFNPDEIFYAIKANPHDSVIKVLKEYDINYDIASKYELDYLLSFNISPEKMSYGNTIKSYEDIRYAYERGIRLFSCDNIDDLKNLMKFDDVKILLRLFVSNESAEWPLSKKFGASFDEIVEMMKIAKEHVYGFTFHVGSQQINPLAWKEAIHKVKSLIEIAREMKINIKMLNLGGGLPALYTLHIPNPKELLKQLKESTDDLNVKVVIEPGRFLVAEAGVIVTKVLGIKNEWIFFDVGKFNGLIETINEAIKYPIFFNLETFDVNCKLMPRLIGGPTCDSEDVLYEKNPYLLPEQINIGDKAYIFSTGAYTYTYSSIWFNGFPPLRVKVMNED